jgi:hypothetical protein
MIQFDKKWTNIFIGLASHNREQGMLFPFDEYVKSREEMLNHHLSRGAIPPNIKTRTSFQQLIL